MDTISKIWVLLLWTQTLSFVKCRDCTLQQFLSGPIYDSNFDTTGMDATYEGGKQVRVPCNTGYTGFFKLICTEGNWIHKGSKCQPKSCGHPGDAQFADFELEIGDDFVFGSQVLFKCQTGYHMVSRTVRRRCLADGWDGVIPVCEAIRCLAFHVDPNVQVLGDPEGATFGNVVRFTCKSSSQILIGSPEVYCNENGVWIGEIPKCQEVKCAVPVIEHGSVAGARQQYNENEVLPFKCDPLYKPTDDRPSRCTKARVNAEWIPTPACKSITCELTQLPGITYRPENKNLFTPGEILQVTCGENDYILDEKTTTADVTCKADGKWNIRPQCQEVRCPTNLQDAHLTRYVSTWQSNKLGNTVQYDCISNYRRTGGVHHATCTRDGWTPKPLCQAINCQKPDLENAEITRNEKQTYTHGETVTYRCLKGVKDSFTATCDGGTWTEIRHCSGAKPCTKPDIPNGFAVGPLSNTVYYSCNEDYKLSSKGWWGEAKCNYGVWSGLHPCIENSMCGEAPEIPNGKVTRKQHRSGERFTVVCDEGYRAETDQAPCHNGAWDLEALKTICSPTAELCSPPPKVEKTIVTTPYQNKYVSGTSVTYQCRKKYMINGEDSITCKDGEWEKKNITCISYCEKLQDVKLTVTSSVDKERFENEDVVEYKCNAPDTNEEGNATCVNSTWTKTVECPAFSCKIELTSGLKISGFPPKDNLVNAGKKQRFFCIDGYDIEGSEEIECLEAGEWNAPPPTCSKKCELPEVPENLRFTPSGDYYFSKGETLTFECREPGFFTEGKNNIECLGQGEWSAPPPICKKKCKVPTLTENVLIHPPVSDIAVSTGQTITFACRHDWLFINGNSNIECSETGEWSGLPPTCAGPPGCKTPPPLEDGDTVVIIKQEYEHNEKVQYVCQQSYVMEGGPYKICKNGAWTGDIRCLKPCTVNTAEMNTRNIEFAYSDKNKLYAPHNGHLTFSCKRGTRKVGSEPMRRKCTNGQMNLPTCQ